VVEEMSGKDIKVKFVDARKMLEADPNVLQLMSLMMDEIVKLENKVAALEAENLVNANLGE
jgi:hypothetical protein